MTKGPAVQSSGASLSASPGSTMGSTAGGGRPPAAPRPAASSSRVTTRTIVETAACPPELKRGDQPWSMHDLRVQRMLGEGNMSNVVHCVCSRSGAHVAVKMYHRDKMNAMNVKQVSREIEIHASLLHPNIVRLYAAFEDADGIYLVQEFAARGDLYVELSRRGGHMPESHVAKNVMIPFLSALTYMHAQGVLHRDIKPENIMLGADGDIKVGDFGLAINTSREKPMSRVGTLDYMPPEIVRLPYGPVAHKHVPHPAEELSAYGLPVDAWCCGVLAYELLVGAPPFEAESKDGTYTRILKLEPFLPTNLSDEARDFIRQALQKDPSKRPTVQALLRHPWLRAYQRPKSMMVLEGSSAKEPAVAANDKQPPAADQQPETAGGELVPAREAASAAAAAAAVSAGAARSSPVSKSLSFSSTMAGRFSAVKPSKPGGFNLMGSRDQQASSGSSSSAASSNASGAAVARASSEDQDKAAAAAERRHSSNGRGQPSEGEGDAAAEEQLASADGKGGTAERVVIHVHADGTAASAAAASAGSGPAAEELIRAALPGGSFAAPPGGANPGTPRGSGCASGGPRGSFAGAIKRKLSSMGSGLFAGQPPAADGGKEDAGAGALAASAAPNSLSSTLSSTSGLSSASATSTDTASGPPSRAVDAIAAVQAPSMQQLLSPAPPPAGPLVRVASLKRTSSGSRSLLSALGKKLSLGGARKLSGAPQNGAEPHQGSRLSTTTS
ncbi:aurora other [Micractinium conductrix]|uniref:Aurora other n=1 Tax=Micractinium conductrix TaxID=554055 RepID=A0A2P6VCX0_9CHLO|nr:aurora other [Micractinium conductrix]|eukprot:PSC71935.1 aurora other [Micractinium conductrix]